MSNSKYIDFDNLHKVPLVPGNIYSSKSGNYWGDLSDNDALNYYFSNVKSYDNQVISGGIKQNSGIKRRTVGLKGKTKRTAYFVICYKENNWFTSGELDIKTSVFSLVGDTNKEKGLKEIRRGNYLLYNAYSELYLKGFEFAFPIFLFKELLNGEYEYIGLGLPFVKDTETLNDVVARIEVEHENKFYNNQLFKFTVDTLSIIDRNWLYDLRIGQGNNSEFKPFIWKKFIIEQFNTNVSNEINRNIVETSTIRTGSTIRKGQSILRKKLLEKKKKCELCEIDYPYMLITSHIVPWSAKDYDDISNARGDLSNVLLLCANHDKLFDKNYISFDENGKILISSSISESEYSTINIHTNMKIDNNIYIEKYMMYHRMKFIEREDY